ncbi:MAG TPA: hypothetical protein VKM54_11450, partial [Myxococcota bacterium]|nr:hypothetical protein [Myxococcota bacterium]
MPRILGPSTAKRSATWARSQHRLANGAEVRRRIQEEKTMNPDGTLLQRFVEYAQAFEKTYVDDDWTRLEPYFAPDAVYRVVG